MLSYPHAGWAEIQIGEWRGPCSYIEEIPNILLQALTSALLKKKTIAVDIDAEYIDYII